MDSTVLFESIVYRKELPEYVDELNKITNGYLHIQAILFYKQQTQIVLKNPYYKIMPPWSLITFPIGARSGQTSIIIL